MIVNEDIYLEHFGVDEDIDVFLDHHGVKGMRWGQRRARRQKEFQAYPRGDKAMVAASAIGAAWVVSTRMAGRGRNPLVAVAAGTIAAAAAGGAARNILDRHGPTPVSALSENR